MGWRKPHGVPGDECVDNRAADVLNIDGIGEGLFRVAARRADREDNLVLGVQLADVVGQQRVGLGSPSPLIQNLNDQFNKTSFD